MLQQVSFRRILISFSVAILLFSSFVVDAKKSKNGSKNNKMDKYLKVINFVGVF